jgi:hypothetical protein
VEGSYPAHSMAGQMELARATGTPTRNPGTRCDGDRVVGRASVRAASSQDTTAVSAGRREWPRSFQSEPLRRCAQRGRFPSACVDSAGGRRSGLRSGRCPSDSSPMEYERPSGRSLLRQVKMGVGNDGCFATVKRWAESLRWGRKSGLRIWRTLVQDGLVLCRQRLARQRAAAELDRGVTRADSGRRFVGDSRRSSGQRHTRYQRLGLRAGRENAVGPSGPHRLRSMTSAACGVAGVRLGGHQVGCFGTRLSGWSPHRGDWPSKGYLLGGSRASALTVFAPTGHPACREVGSGRPSGWLESGAVSPRRREIGGPSADTPTRTCP